MGVKTATKKRLMDLGLPRPYAHLWANDIRMDELVQLNLEETMKHLYRHNRKIQERMGRSPEDLVSYNSFCREGPTSILTPNDKVFPVDGKTFMNYISNFIEGAKVIEGELRVLHPLDWKKDVMMDRWGQKNPPRLLLNYSDLPSDNKT